MAPDTFPKFLQLPKEVQILIWEAAVRPVPGNRHVHRFSIADYRVPQPTPTRPIKGRFLRLMHNKNFEYDSLNIASGLSLAIPTDDVAGYPNDSVCLTDSSLWTVCRESRRAMERHFAKNEWWSRVKSPFHPKRTAEPGQYAGQKGASHTASYQDIDGIVKHITIDPDNDLVHLDPRWLEHVDWLNIDDSGFLSLVDETPSLERSGFSFLGSNIAMDYDPSVFDYVNDHKFHYKQIGLGMDSATFQDLITYLTEIAEVTVWFIDYSLVRAQHITRSPDEGRAESSQQSKDNVDATRDVFRSNDFIYTEVEREDIGTSWIVSNSDDEVNSGKKETAFDMLDTLSLILSDGNLGTFRVLACESVVGRMPQPRIPWAQRCACYPDILVPRMPPSTIRREGSESSSDISSSDLIAQT
ncbi:glutathione s-transferase omega 2 [Fusarium circinatum]|uniref:Glutathione s-transferase omega 2 n=1 Tax=Fusarium circinatum TaxID=48490 RepID=A0A8H5U0I4_FUSCI|nr:glutathione s-transferase omega 2 [Fusarium circinatum]